jgi:hypothetical protein
MLDQKVNLIKQLKIILTHISIFFFFLFFSCAIDSVVFLNKNPIPTSNNESSLIFKGPESSNASYLGVEIFYKIYASITDAESDKSSISTRQDSSDSVPGSLISSYLLNPNALHYVRLILADDDGILSIIPTIKSEDIPTQSYFITIEFPSASNQEPFINIINEVSNEISYSLLLKRIGIGNDSVSFLEEPKSDDTDYKSNEADTDPHIYYLQLYAASYGLNFNDFSELYGDAIFIGRITLNFR